MAGKEVTKVKTTDVSPWGEFGAHAGFEDVKATDLSIPFVNVMQSNSPEVEDEKAKGGDLLNSVSKEIMKQPVVLMPVKFEHAVVEWVPRMKGGGLVARHEPDAPIYLEAIKKNNGSRIPPEDSEGKRIPFKSPDGNDLVETHYAYCLILDDDGLEAEGYGVLSFSSTKIKVFKNMLTNLYMIKGNPPLFANRIKLSTSKQTNKAGKGFYNYNIGPFKDTFRESLLNPKDEVQRALMHDGMKFAEMISAGLASADFESISETGGNEEGTEGVVTPF